MSAVENRKIIQRLVEEYWNKGNVAVLDEVFAPNYFDHDAFQGMTPDRDGLKQTNNMFLAAFSEGQTTIDDLLCEGDKVAWRWTFRGRNTGSLAGIPPTNKTISVSGTVIDRFAGGQIVERWSTTDMFGLMQQLGVIPMEKQAGG